MQPELKSAEAEGKANMEELLICLCNSFPSLSLAPYKHKYTSKCPHLQVAFSVHPQEKGRRSNASETQFQWSLQCSTKVHCVQGIDFQTQPTERRVAESVSTLPLPGDFSSTQQGEGSFCRAMACSLQPKVGAGSPERTRLWPVVVQDLFHIWFSHLCCWHRNLQEKGDQSFCLRKTHMAGLKLNRLFLC